jgi:hypothetical protein
MEYLKLLEKEKAKALEKESNLKEVLEGVAIFYGEKQYH